ncbi:ABC transporter permease [Streptomyces sp. NPDC047024]|uniref:ABC transporter permease n=1 Tax=Streptomyces sp. NPDC047024 TaxID=3155476 RepID=UPI0033F319A5
MSTLTVSARPRPARWTFRLHRWALFVWAALVLAGSGLLLWVGGPLADRAARAWQELQACQVACTIDTGNYAPLYELLTEAMILLPFLVAVWAGAALTARETESGTAALAWTQGITPVRWLAVRLALPAAAVTAGAILLVALHRYAWQATANQVGLRPAWWLPRTFHANGPTTVAVCLAALAAGALTGLLVRRTLPSIGITVAATVLLYAGAHWLMPYLWPPVTKVNGFEGGYAGEFAGVEVAHGMVTRSGAHVPTPDCTEGSLTACKRLYAQHGGTGLFSEYHPESHYWPLQLTTSALLLAVTALLTAASFAVLRRRTG